jgi:hypothetical protein
MEDHFEILAAKVLAGEGSAEDEAHLQEMLAQSPELRAEFAELRSAWTLLKEMAPLAGALDTPPVMPPAERLEKWRAAVARKYATDGEPVASPAETRQSGRAISNIAMWVRHALRSPAALAAAVIFIVAIVSAVLLSRQPSRSNTGGPIAYLIANAVGVEVKRDSRTIAVKFVTALRHGDQLRLVAQASATVITPSGQVQLSGPETRAASDLVPGSGASEKEQTNVARSLMRTALFQPAGRLAGLLAATRNGRGIPVYSPVGFTENLTPPLLWKSEPGKTYEISIADELAPTVAPLRLTGVFSPIEFTNAWPGRALERDGLYRLRLTEAGKPFTATELTFRTVRPANGPLPNEPAERVLVAYRFLNANPARIGDALAILLTLPPEVANSELAQRLELFALGQLGYHEDFHASLARLEAGK